MNSFECVGTVKEVAINKGSYTTKLWRDGVKTNTDITVNTYRGKVSVEINGYSMDLTVDAQDRKIFCQGSDAPKMDKGYPTIEKLLNLNGAHPKMKFTGEVTDGSYYAAKRDVVTENVDWTIKFVNEAPEGAEEECFLNTITRFKKNVMECQDEDGNFMPGKENLYKMEAWITPSYGKKYFPMRSSYKDKFVYIDKELFEDMIGLISDDGKTPTRSMKITYEVKFVHKGGAAKKIERNGGFGKSREVSTGVGWDEMEVHIVGGDYYEEEIAYNDDGEEYIANAKMFITNEDLKEAMAAYKQKLAGLKEKYLTWKNKSAAAAPAIDDDEF